MAHGLKLKGKLKLPESAEYRMNVSAACKYMGVSRFSYYHIKKAYDKGGVEALAPKSRKVPNLKNRVYKKVEREVLKLSLEDLTLGKKKMSRVLKDKGIVISPTGARNVWVRHGLQTKEV
jgi:transposase